jgi:hypothetical protein
MDKTPKKPIDKRGKPVLKVTAPGYSKGAGTPSWLSKPARAAERKAK